MKVYFTYIGIDNKIFFELEVSSSLTVSELMEFEEVQNVIKEINHDIVIGVNSELLDGNFKPLPNKYRLREGERVEILRPLTQDPKERRLKKI
jgi:putative ubiquitin-RnfH superfamily antitoxin RatB of RatAB toxin-antitoxin module|tara:strand:+ start:263 stop:541 length:279 start_codon:yes stop_codon:yes gene_type:complete